MRWILVDDVLAEWRVVTGDGSEIGVLAEFGDSGRFARVGGAGGEVADGADVAENVIGDGDIGEIDISGVGYDVGPCNRIPDVEDRSSRLVGVLAVRRLLDINRRNRGWRQLLVGEDTRDGLTGIEIEDCCIRPEHSS